MFGHGFIFGGSGAVTPFDGTLLGSMGGVGASTTDPISLTGSIAVSVGDLIAILIAQQNTQTTVGITDNLGNTYAGTTASLDAGTVAGVWRYSIVTVAGTLTQIDVDTTGTGGNNWAMCAAVFQGPFTTADKQIAPVEDVTSPFTCPSSGVLTQARELVLSFIASQQGNDLAPTSPNLAAATSGAAAAGSSILANMGYQITAATTAVSPAWTASDVPSDDVLSTGAFF